MNWVGYLRAENITILIPHNFPDFFLNEKFELYVKIQGMNFGPIKVSVIQLSLDVHSSFLDIDFVVCPESVWKLEILELR